ncbi:MAG: hypothetical protein IDH49_02000 [Gammaproteobacteria bacterium]|nr:hypothetical protein [Gammaproteobacteria bacterium]
MQITETDLIDRYQTLSTEELLALQRSGQLTELAQTVLKKELARRPLPREEPEEEEMEIVTFENRTTSSIWEFSLMMFFLAVGGCFSFLAKRPFDNFAEIALIILLCGGCLWFSIIVAGFPCVSVTVRPGSTVSIRWRYPFKSETREVPCSALKPAAVDEIDDGEGGLYYGVRFALPDGTKVIFAEGNDKQACMSLCASFNAALDRPVVSAPAGALGPPTVPNSSIGNRQMFTFAIRPGYGTNDLLIEFFKGAGSDEMISALREVLTEIGAKTVSIEDLWQNDEMVYHMDSNVGEFELSLNVWDCIFIIPAARKSWFGWGNATRNRERRHATVSEIEAALLRSGKFVREEVKFADYS